MRRSVVHPETLGGKPIVEGTRLSVEYFRLASLWYVAGRGCRVLSGAALNDVKAMIQYAPVMTSLRAHEVSAREKDWSNLPDSELLAREHGPSRFVMTHDTDFGA